MHGTSGAHERRYAGPHRKSRHQSAQPYITSDANDLPVSHAISAQLAATAQADMVRMLLSQRHMLPYRPAAAVASAAAA